MFFMLYLFTAIIYMGNIIDTRVSYRILEYCFIVINITEEIVNQFCKIIF